MGNPFFLPDIPAHPSSGAAKRHNGRLLPALMLLICCVCVFLLSAAILLTLSDAFPAGVMPATVIAELE